MSDRRVLVNLRGLLTPDPARTWVVDRIPDAALALEGGRVAWLGRRADLPAAWTSAVRVDGGGAWASPGFVDPHTHLLFGGNRSGEFNRRLQGARIFHSQIEGPVKRIHAAAKANLHAATRRPSGLLEFPDRLASPFECHERTVSPIRERIEQPPAPCVVAGDGNVESSGRFLHENCGGPSSVTGATAVHFFACA